MKAYYVNEMYVTYRKRSMYYIGSRYALQTGLTIFKRVFFMIRSYEL